MQIDKDTLHDLSIFNSDESVSVFNYLNQTSTVGGKEILKYLVGNPLASVEKIKNAQVVIKALANTLPNWPTSITNGTIMVVAKYYETQLDLYPQHPTFFNSQSYKIFHAPDYALTKYTIIHCKDFLNGLFSIHSLLLSEIQNPIIADWARNIEKKLNKPALESLRLMDVKNATPQLILKIAGQIRTKHKQDFYDLIDLYSWMDAYQSLARVTISQGLSFPNFTISPTAYIEATNCYHPLLVTPTPYNITLKKDSNFLFLTGANMAGKSTFIKAVGISVYLAHIGMGVPATSMNLTLFDGMLSNINVMDNIIKGESYFYNEVKRIKNTIEKINDGKNWLILIDELFKGTNVEDAMKCSTAVIEGLRKIKPSLFILSTHLYEIGDHLKQFPSIQFKYFETSVNDGELIFSYQLKEGISNDRLGYLILQKEGVVDLLKSL
jgi:DNA mismatch repair ATPase MutS